MAKTLQEWLENMDEHKVIELWNTYCDFNNYEDQTYCLNEYEFETQFNGLSAWEVVQKIEGCDFNTSNDYFYYDNQGNITSTDDIADVVNYEALAQWHYLYQHLEEDDAVDEFLSDFEYLNEDNEDEIRDYLEEYCDMLVDDWEEVAKLLVDELELIKVESEN